MTASIDDLNAQVAGLTQNVSNLLTAVNVQKSFIDNAAASLSGASAIVTTVTTKAAEANASAVAAQAAANSVTSVVAQVQQATTAASTATDKANIATTKATEASTSATNAQTAATSATNSASTATTKATQATTAATNAQNAQTAAANSATTASTSATNAQNAATSATGSATQATTKAGEANASATQAATSATQAANSATTATTKANQAASSEAIATTKAAEATAAATTATTKAAEIVTAAATATTKANEASTSAASATSIANSLDAALQAFRKIHLGTLTADPTTDGNGNALLDGAEYFNSVTDKLRQYVNGSWHNADEAVQNATNSAVLSASNASTSASQAATSASTATTKADIATTKATEAATSATAANNSATTAATKATEAATSATSVAALATAAGNSATQASNSASTATTKATLATTKADEAAASALAASASKDAALTAASNAATSESNAVAAASTATTKATTATTKANLATTKADEAAASALAAQNAAASVAGIDITIGSVTSGANASASITGAAPNKVLNLVLVKGDKGDKAWIRRGAWSNSVADYKIDDYVTHLGSTHLRITNASGASATPPANDPTNWITIAEKGADGTGAITSIGVSGPLTITPGSDPIISLPQASTTQPGFLSQADFSTFASKLSSMPTVTLTGDFDGGGTTTIVGTLKTVNSNTGTFGTSVKVPRLTTNDKGLVTSVSEVDIAFPDVSGKQSVSEKDQSGGYAGLTLFKLNIFNALGTVKSFMRSIATAARTYTFPDKDITVAGLDDIAATSTGVNTGDETAATIKSKLGITTLSGNNTGDQTLASLGIPNVENKNSATIRSEISSSNVTSALGFVPADSNHTHSTYQPIDADLTAIAGLVGTSGLLKKTAADTWTLDTSTYLTSVNKASVGLSNVDNTSDANKPISTATQTALDGKQPTLVSSTNIKTVNGVSILGAGNIAIASGPANTDGLTEGGSNLYFTAARVLASALTGLSTTTGGAVISTDTVLGAMGKFQKNMADLTALLSGKQDYSANLTTWAGKAVPSGDVIGTSDTQTLTNKTFQGFKEVNATLTGTTPVITGSNGTLVTWNLTGPSTPTTTLADGESVLLKISDGPSATINWALVGVVWKDGTVPTLATTGYTQIELWRVGSVIHGSKVGDFAS